MKKFLKKTAIFFITFIILVEAFCFLLIVTNLYFINYPGSEIYTAINKSKEKSPSKILLLGDSVGRQLFPNTINNDSINSLATNQAIGMVGQFLLLNNYLKSGNEVEKVIILFTPFSFDNNLNQEYTYHYFLKPFYNAEYTAYFSETVKGQIKKIPYHNFVQVPHIKVTSWAPAVDKKDDVDYTFLSPVSKEYLKKIKALSMQYKFQLDIIPTPVSIENKPLIESMDRNEITSNNLNHEFKNYFKDIIYLESAEFGDKIHLTTPEKYREKFKNMILNRGISGKDKSQLITLD